MVENDARGANVVVQEIGPWSVEMRWPSSGIQGGPCEVIVRPTNPEEQPGGGISSTVLRQINIQEAADALRTALAVDDHRRENRESREKERAARLKEILEREGISDSYLALLSSAYVRAVNDGQKNIQSHLGNFIAKGSSTVKGHLWQARKRGLLTESTGRAGGQLTDKASEILRQIVPGGESLKSITELPDTTEGTSG
jgi:hypothetical protein